MKSRWEGILASNFNGFGLIFGGKLRLKMEPRSIQKGIEKTMEKKGVLEAFWAVLEASWAVLEALGGILEALGGV